MGRQVLNGISPIAISRCNLIPSHCNVTDSDVQILFSKGKSLTSETKVTKDVNVINFTAYALIFFYFLK